MKITCQECDACGHRKECGLRVLPVGWGTLKVPGDDDRDLCSMCLPLILAAVAERKKAPSPAGVGT